MATSVQANRMITRESFPLCATVAALLAWLWHHLVDIVVLGALALGGCVLFLSTATTTEIEDGSADVKMSLTVTGLPIGQAVGVAWSHLEGARPHAVWVDEPWEVVQADNARCTFRSQGRAQMSVHRSALRESGGWYFASFEWRLLVIVAGGKRYRFEAPSIFGGRYPLRRPEVFEATFDIDDYLSGKKEPPALDWPPDNVARAPSERGERNSHAAD